MSGLLFILRVTPLTPLMFYVSRKITTCRTLQPMWRIRAVEHPEGALDQYLHPRLASINGHGCWPARQISLGLAS